MILFLDIFLIVLMFSFFGISHTVLASDFVKIKVKESFPNFLPFYRISYNLSSVIFFYLFILFSPKPDIILFDLAYPFDLVMLFPQILSLAGLVWTLFHIDGKEFLGINQIIKKLKNQYNYSSLDEESKLRISGPYKFSRHPIYLFSIIFILFRPTMTLFYATSVGCFITYFFIGSIYEERKLVEKFGNEYSIYQSNVGRIFPSIKSLIR